MILFEMVFVERQDCLKRDNFGWTNLGQNIKQN